MGERTVKRFIKELKDLGLIGTTQPQAGGLNHFKFYDHPWMYRKLTPEFNTNASDPVPHLARGSASPGTGVVPHLARISSKEVKRSKKDICTSVPDMPITASQTNLKTKTKPKPHATKEVLEYVEIWNEIAGDEGCPKVGNNKRQLGTIKRHLEVIKQKWEAELSPKSFKTWLVAGIEAQHYMFTTYHQSMDVCLKWKNFNDIYNKIESAE